MTKPAGKISAACQSAALAVLVFNPALSEAKPPPANPNFCSSSVQHEIATEVCPTGFVGLSLQEDGSEALLCMPSPADWNGDVVFHARGTTQFSGDCKLASVIGQLDFDNTSIPQILNDLGFGFATTSCSADVLAIPQCKEAMSDLLKNFSKKGRGGYLEELEAQNEEHDLAYGGFSGDAILTGVSWPCCRSTD